MLECQLQGLAALLSTESLPALAGGRAGDGSPHGGERVIRARLSPRDVGCPPIGDRTEPGNERAVCVEFAVPHGRDHREEGLLPGVGQVLRRQTWKVPPEPAAQARLQMTHDLRQRLSDFSVPSTQEGSYSLFVEDVYRFHGVSGCPGTTCSLARDRRSNHEISKSCEIDGSGLSAVRWVRPRSSGSQGVVQEYSTATPSSRPRRDRMPASMTSIALSPSS